MTMPHPSPQRGSAAAAVAIIVALVLIGAGAAYYFSTRPTSQEEQRMEEKKMMEQKEAMVQPDASPIPAAGDTMMKKEGETVMKKEEGVMVKYAGTVLAGTSAPLLDFTKTDFDAAVKSDKLVVLYFYANWCPICREEFPKAQAAFNELTTDQAIGFRVNFNDNQTDADEVALAREHGIGYQHTKLFIKNGKQILKSPESWEQSRYVTEITNTLAK